MFPRLFSIGPFTVYTYGALMALAFAVGLRVAVLRARSRGLDTHAVLDLGIYVIVAAVVGARLLLLVVDVRRVVADPMEALALARSGGVFYGGLAAAVGVALWQLRRRALPVWATCDVFAPGIAAGHAVGRVGCFCAGCCYGRPTIVPWGVTFHDAFAAAFVGTPLGVALHPVQLYEAAAEVAILAALLWIERRGRSFAGRTICVYLALYAGSRFVIEFFRGDARGALGALSTSQVISAVVLPASLAMLVLLARRANRTGHDTHGASPLHR
jgi:phosphatidylglycerol:prolipoprotein diacylglycerol transferase